MCIMNKYHNEKQIMFCFFIIKRIKKPFTKLFNYGIIILDRERVNTMVNEFQLYHICECECGKKRIRSFEKDILTYFTDNNDYTCASCESTFSYKGTQRLIGDKGINEKERKYVVREKPKYLTYDNLINLKKIDFNGMPTTNSIGNISDALSLAIDNKDDALIKRIFLRFEYKIRSDCWPYISKGRKKYLQKLFPSQIKEC